MRTGKTVNGTTTYYLYDGDQLLEEQVERGGMAALQSMYLVGADGLRARYSNDGQSDLYTYVYSYDPEGSLCQMQLTKNYSALNRYAENTFCYDAWGQLLGDIKVSTGAAQVPFDAVGFGGQYGYHQDPETGLYQLGARYYDAGKGRFVNRDPIGYGGGANLYGFCGNNPVNESDPSGNDAIIVYGADHLSGDTYFLKAAEALRDDYDAKHKGKHAYIYNAKSYLHGTLHGPAVFDFALTHTHNIDTIMWLGHAGITDDGMNCTPCSVPLCK